MKAALAGALLLVCTPAMAWAERPAPDHADVAYGPHERNRVDLWLPASGSNQQGWPLVVYFHGGGFVGGDKGKFDPRSYLGIGYAVASANYRFVNGRDVLTPVPMQDGARVVQYLRHHASTFGLDPRRIALSGGSAGAVIAMWIAYSDDLADPESEDPVCRESTRVSCLIPRSGPTNLDPDWVREHLGGPEEEHTSMRRFYGEGDYRGPAIRKLVDLSSPLHLATADDPPTFLVYAGELDNLPLPEDAEQGLRIHHPYFGKVLKDRLDELGVENEFYHGRRRPSAHDIKAFLDRHLHP